MQLSSWFHRQLQASGDGFVWAVSLIPPERHFLPPLPDYWSAARLVYHLQFYDRFIGLPAIRQWLGAPLDLGELTGNAKENAALEEKKWNNGQGYDVPTLLEAFKQCRAEHLALIQNLPESLWHEERDIRWGTVTLHWVVTKTYQHTLEHTNSILRSYLWWK